MNKFIPLLAMLALTLTACDKDPRFAAVEDKARAGAPAAFGRIGYTIIGEASFSGGGVCYTAKPTDGVGNKIHGCISGSYPNEVTHLKTL